MMRRNHLEEIQNTGETKVREWPHQSLDHNSIEKNIERMTQKVYKCPEARAKLWNILRMNKKVLIEGP